jgi:ribonuclease P protein component
MLADARCWPDAVQKGASVFPLSRDGKKPSNMPIRIGRLRKRSEFLRVAASGRKCAVKGVVLQVRICGTDIRHADPDAQANIWFGITASRRVGGAVARNRVKRRLRAAAAKILAAQGAVGYDYVLIGRQSTLTRPFPALLSDLSEAMRRVGAIRSEADHQQPPKQDAP